MSDQILFEVAPGGCLRGRLRVPGDKSISHRSIMLGSLAEGVTRIRGFLQGQDSLNTLRAFRSMGVEIEGPEQGEVTIRGVGLHGLRPPPHPLDLGNSGTSMRLMSGLLAGQGFDTVLAGDASLSRRPMGRVTEPLALMGAWIDTDEGGTAPLHIHGDKDLHGIHYSLPVASAQIKSCVLLAGLYADGTTCVTEPAPTRDHTERMLHGFGWPLRRDGATVCLEGGGHLRGREVEVPADISSAAFFLVGASIAEGSDLLLEHVGMNPTRTGVIEILRRMGANLEINNQREVAGEPVADIRVRSAALHGIDIPDDQVPLAIDEFPVLFVAAACARGRTVLTGAEELRVKESDRIQVMADGLLALGIDATPTPGGMVIEGGSLHGGTIDSHGDHRIAMAFAMATLRADGPVTIHDCANVNTSFPGFVDQARAVGLSITLKGGTRGPVTGSSVITIDGPSGTGKGTVGHWLARRLGWHFLDSGALYRVVALAARKAGVSLDDEQRLAALARDLDVEFNLPEGEDEVRVLLGGEDVGVQLRTEECGNDASKVAALGAVRAALLARQRDFRSPPGLVADGRDMGTTVFPDARLKLFLTASSEVRGERRYKQLKQKGLDVTLAELVQSIDERDARDQTRGSSPLRPAADAWTIDTSHMSVEEVEHRVRALVEGALPG